MSYVLVTGATGFIGMHLCSWLAKQGHRVRGTTRGAPADDESGAVSDWALVGEIGGRTQWGEALRDIDCVVHLAGLAHQPDSSDQASLNRYAEINTEGTKSLAEAIARSASVKRLLFVSSVGATTSSSVDVITVKTPCRPDTAYGASKLEAERVLQDILRETPADWCILRPPLVYGPGNPGNMERLLRLIETRAPLPFGRIENQRSFIYVGNLVDAIGRCLSHPGASRNIFLVADTEHVSTPELIRLLARHAEFPVRLFSVPLGLLRAFGRIGDFASRWLGRPVGVDSRSIDRLCGSLVICDAQIRSETGWTPPYRLDEGLKILVEARPL